MIYLKLMLQKLIIFFYNLSLKKAVIGLFILSLFLSIPIIYLLSQRDKANFSEAGNNENVSSSIDESLIPYPEYPPKIEHITKFYGKPGDSILILGLNFGQVRKESIVLFNNKPVLKDDIKYWSDNEVEVSLPSKLGIYTVSISVNGKKSTWFGKVYVFNKDTKPVIEIKNDKNFVKVKDVDSVIAYTVSGSLNVFGTRNIKNIKKEVPLKYTNSNILYIELLKKSKPILFRVIER